MLRKQIAGRIASRSASRSTALLEAVEAIRTYLIREYTTLLREEVALAMLQRTPDVPWGSVQESVAIVSDIDCSTSEFELANEIASGIYYNHRVLVHRGPKMSDKARWALHVEFLRNCLAGYRELVRYCEELKRGKSS